VYNDPAPVNTTDILNVDRLIEYKIFVTDLSFTAYVTLNDAASNGSFIASAWTDNTLLGYTGQSRWVNNSNNVPLTSCPNSPATNVFGVNYADWISNGANTPGIQWVGCGMNPWNGTWTARWDGFETQQCN
jgi:hypothetical protein